MPGQAADVWTTPDELMSAIRSRYLQSRDFNGLHLHGPAGEVSRAAAIELVERGLVQVMTSEDYLNIHIRPWPSRRSGAAQIENLKALGLRDYGVCLYPTSAAMKGVRLPRRFNERPFAKAMARGRGTLELAYFSLDVLEQYRNDPRYMFSFGDSGAYMSVTDEAYEDSSEPDQDKVSLGHIGFAYDTELFDPDNLESTIVRRAAVFYCDLVTLSPEHQQRWKTYEVPSGNLEPHPLWWGSQMGHWPEGVGPVERLFIELGAINDLTTRAFGTPLFKTDQRPPDFGWLLRPSQREWDDFILQFDKLLSENLRTAFFDAMGVIKKGEDGNTLATISRLRLFMTEHGVTEASAQAAIAPLREIRRARQKPAHQLRTNLSDRTFVHRQLALLWSVNQTLIGLRDWLSCHPFNIDWSHPRANLRDYRI